MIGGALVVGEALIDEVREADRIQRHPGGSPANVALGLSRLNVPTRLHTAIGGDADGRLIREHLTRSGVTLTEESLTGSPTSRAVANLAPDGSATYEFALSWRPQNLDELGTPEVVHTGSLGAFLAPGSDLALDIVRRARLSGALVTFDPNVRPALASDLDAARHTFNAFAFSSNVTKLSDEDAASLFPGKSVDEVLDLLVSGGVAVAAVTRGGAGASLASGEHRVSIPPVVTKVADTVGAGDSFMAALIRGLVFQDVVWDGNPIPLHRLEKVGRAAARAAGITVSRRGADLPLLNELLNNH